MQQTRYPQSIDNQQFLLSARSACLQLNCSHDHVEQDLQLLIRAHQRIRQLEEENIQARQEQQKLLDQASTHRRAIDQLLGHNAKLQRLNNDLQTKIISLEQQLNLTSVLQLPDKTQNRSSRLRKSDLPHVQTEALQSIDQLQKQQPQKILKQSESTPVILNINLNPFSKQQRQSFLTSCKQQFAQQLSKIKHSQTSAFKHPRHSDYCLPTSTKASQLPRSRFAKQAHQDFMDENTKTLTNLYFADRRKSASSTSGSLIRKNLIGKRYGDEGDRVMFGDRTNVWNSKYASIDQIIAGSNVDASKNSQNGFWIQPSYGIKAINDAAQRKQSNYKNKSIYFKNKISGSLYQEKSSLTKNKRKEIQLQLRNRQAGGMIKYRGLCL